MPLVDTFFCLFYFYTSRTFEATSIFFVFFLLYKLQKIPINIFFYKFFVEIFSSPSFTWTERKPTILMCLLNAYFPNFFPPQHQYVSCYPTPFTDTPYVYQ